MNKWLGILLVSLALNAALAIAVFRQPHAAPSPKPAPTAQPKSATPAPAPPAAPAARAPQTTFQWALLESDDFKKYIANLRAFGVSEKVIRDIILADVARMYRPKLAAVRGAKRGLEEKFWEHPSVVHQSPFVQTREQRDQERALRREQNELVKSLLGEDVFQQVAKDAGVPDWAEGRLGTVPPELRDKVEEIRSRYQDAESDLLRDHHGQFDEFADDDRRKLQRQMHDELAALLTPEQLKDYELRNSATAEQLRADLAWFEPSESEFRALFDFARSREELNAQANSPDTPPLTPDNQKALWEKFKALENTLARAIGTNRLQDYQFASDWAYRSLLDAGVAKDSVLKVANIKKQAESAIREIMKNQALTPDQRAAARKAVQAEAQNALAGVLDASQLKTYQGLGGWWPQNLAPGAQP